MAGRFILGEIQLQLGEVDDAIASLEKSTGLAQYCKAVGYEVHGQAWLASAHARKGPLEREDFQEPLQRALSGTDHGAYPEAFADDARALAAAGKTVEAQPHLAAAQQLFAELGIRPEPQRSRWTM